MSKYSEVYKLDQEEFDISGGLRNTICRSTLIRDQLKFLGQIFLHEWNKSSGTVSVWVSYNKHSSSGSSNFLGLMKSQTLAVQQLLPV